MKVGLWNYFVLRGSNIECLHFHALCKAGTVLALKNVRIELRSEWYLEKLHTHKIKERLRVKTLSNSLEMSGSSMFKV